MQIPRTAYKERTFVHKFVPKGALKLRAPIGIKTSRCLFSMSSGLELPLQVDHQHWSYMRGISYFKNLDMPWIYHNFKKIKRYWNFLLTNIIISSRLVRKITQWSVALSLRSCMCLLLGELMLILPTILLLHLISLNDLCDNWLHYSFRIWMYVGIFYLYTINLISHMHYCVKMVQLFRNLISFSQLSNYRLSEITFHPALAFTTSYFQ